MNVIADQHDQITARSWLRRDPMPIGHLGTKP